CQALRTSPNVLRAGFAQPAVWRLVCFSGGPGQPSYTEVRFPSGKMVKVLGTETIHFSQDDPALMLKCQTDCNLGSCEGGRAHPRLERCRHLWTTQCGAGAVSPKQEVALPIRALDG